MFILTEVFTYRVCNIYQICDKNRLQRLTLYNTNMDNLSNSLIQTK